jgi:hypothetical protein
MDGGVVGGVDNEIDRGNRGRSALKQREILNSYGAQILMDS